MKYTEYMFVKVHAFPVKVHAFPEKVDVMYR